MTKPKIGRPPSVIRRVPLSLRVTPEIRKLLDERAAQQGRSISQEAELRLELSFDREATVKQTLDSLKAGVDG